jgi:hypothetical protein
MKSKAEIRNTQGRAPEVLCPPDILALFNAAELNFPKQPKTLLIFTPQERNEKIQIVNEPAACYRLDDSKSMMSILIERK